MSTTIEKEFNTIQKRLIIFVSIVIPIAVALLFSIKIPGVDLSFLPPIYASINAITSLLLISALVFIKRGNVQFHERLMKTALLCSILFLLMYVAYHITSDPTPFGGEGIIKTVYFVLLISHILLSIVVIPFVLFSYAYAVSGQIERHKKLVKFAFPLWLYVAITGVVVYLMIAPYYV
jgi:putative membrane protein